MNFDSLDTGLEVSVDKRLVEVSTHSRLLEQSIANWLGIDYQFIGNVIGVVEEVGDRIELTDENIGDLSFRCLNKKGELLKVGLFYDGEMNQDRFISICNEAFEIVYQYINVGNEIKLVFVQQEKIKKPVSRVKRFMDEDWI